MSVVFAMVTALSLLSPSTVTALSLPKATGRWIDWPAVGHVVRLPAIPYPNWKPGHRGIDLALTSGTSIMSPATGKVTWVGVVNGVPSITIVDRHGYKHSLLPVETTLQVDETVLQGEVIGKIVASNHCRVSCVHWSMRRGRQYVDPRWFAPPMIYRLPPRKR
jgi:murein DD-endopeptidase MepM/ murein hydrolase activator NlpD